MECHHGGSPPHDGQPRDLLIQTQRRLRLGRMRGCILDALADARASLKGSGSRLWGVNTQYEDCHSTKMLLKVKDISNILSRIMTHFAEIRLSVYS